MDGMEVEFVQDEVHETGIDGFGIDVGECAVDEGDNELSELLGDLY